MSPYSDNATALCPGLWHHVLLFTCCGMLQTACFSSAQSLVFRPYTHMHTHTHEHSLSLTHTCTHTYTSTLSLPLTLSHFLSLLSRNSSRWLCNENSVSARIR